MSLENPLWGAPGIHGELLKLGIDVGQASVTKYMARWHQPLSQGLKTFLRSHAAGIVSIDLFVVPTVSFPLLSGLLMLSQDDHETQAEAMDLIRSLIDAIVLTPEGGQAQDRDPGRAGGHPAAGRKYKNARHWDRAFLGCSSRANKGGCGERI